MLKQTKDNKFLLIYWTSIILTVISIISHSDYNSGTIVIKLNAHQSHIAQIQYNHGAIENTEGSRSIFLMEKIQLLAANSGIEIEKNWFELRKAHPNWILFRARFQTFNSHSTAQKRITLNWKFTIVNLKTWNWKQKEWKITCSELYFVCSLSTPVKMHPFSPLIASLILKIVPLKLSG